MATKLKTAQLRNHKILRLRGMWATAGILLTRESKMVQAAIDRELVTMGAQAQSERLAEYRKMSRKVRS